MPTNEWIEVDLSALVFDDKNARLHPEANVKAVNDSLTEFGQVENIVVHKATMRIIAGNCRVAEMLKLGQTTAMANVIDLSEAKARRLAIILNRSADLAEWDEDALAKLLRDLDTEEEVDLSGLGFESDQIDALLASLEEPDPEPGDGGNGVPFSPVIAYSLVFETTDQQDRWFQFLRDLKRAYPDDATAAHRVVRALDMIEIPAA